MQSLLEQATQALQRERFMQARELVEASFSSAAPCLPQNELLEVLAQAQEGLHDEAGAARTWHRACRQAHSAAERWRLFERAVQAYQRLQDYPALLCLARQHLTRANTVQERANCLLIVGEALLQLRRYQEARTAALEPALRLVEVPAETRVYLWHNLGLSHLAEHAFVEAASAFRQSTECILGLYYSRRSAQAPAPSLQLHHMRNTALFYQGVIHLLYQRPQHAVQMLQNMQRPTTPIGTWNGALYLALACCALQQPEAAERALLPLTRATDLPESLRGPVALVLAGVANLRQALPAVGTYLEAALEAPLTPRTSWEPSWRALWYQALGLALQNSGYRAAAIACYEEALKAIVHRTGHWQDSRPNDWLRGASLLTAIENLPLHTCSVATRGELLRVLQTLAWLYDTAAESLRADTALSLALRLATTPEQCSYLWLQRGWLAATRAAWSSETAAEEHRNVVAVGLQQARVQDAKTGLGCMLSGIEALLQQRQALAQRCFADIPACPEAPETQALCVTLWLWSQATQGTLPQAFASAQSPITMLSVTRATLTRALELLLAWSTASEAAGPEAVLTWVEPLLASRHPHMLPIFQRLCQADALPTAQQTVLITALQVLSQRPAHDVLADHAAALLGQQAVLARLTVLLTSLSPPTAPTATGSGTMRRQPKHRSPSALQSGMPDTERALSLVRLLEQPENLSPHLAEQICAWLINAPHLGTQAPQVVSALLGLLRQCPNATPAMQRLLAQATLSRRQRQLLEVALLAADPEPPPDTTLLAWEPLRHWSLVQLCAALQEASPPTLAHTGAAPRARTWYLLALLLSRVGLLAGTEDCLHACLRLQPGQPLAHFMLGQILRLQHRYTLAFQATQRAWEILQAHKTPSQVIHCEILNQLLALLRVTNQYDRLSPWATAFEDIYCAIDPACLSAMQQRRLHEESGEFALSRALYLASLPPIQQTAELMEQQVHLLQQAIDHGTLSTQHVAQHRQAETLARLQRHDEAAAAYVQILQHWPEDRSARFRLALLTAVRQATVDASAAEQAWNEALGLAFAHVPAPPTPLTADTALSWLQQATPRTPGVLEVLDALTACAGICLKRHEFTRAIAMLTTLDARVAQPRQAYYLAEAFYGRSQRAATLTEQCHDAERALHYAERALTSSGHHSLVSTLLTHIQAHGQRLAALQQRANTLADYRARVCHVLTRCGVRFEVGEPIDEAPGQAWLTLAELVEPDEASGNPDTTIRLAFARRPGTAEPQPGEPDIALYAQYQQDIQRVMRAYSMDALPWPRTVYTGATDFARIFPERLALNRDLVFLVYAEHRALVRYAQALQLIMRLFAPVVQAAMPPPVPTLLAAARYMTMEPLLHQRLRVVAGTSRNKAGALPEGMVFPAGLTLTRAAPWQTLPVFVDAQTYFQAVTGALHPVLATPLAGAMRLHGDTDAPPRRSPAPRRSKPVRTGKQAAFLAPEAFHTRLPPGAR